MHDSVFLFVLYCSTSSFVISDNVLDEDGSRVGHVPAQSYAPQTSKSSYSALSEAMTLSMNQETNSAEACHDDISCLQMASHDRLGLEAIKTLHKQLDDDENGNVDLTESDDFLREELKYDSGYEKRQKAFHYNDDTHISVRELWEAWLRSEVHNWTVEQTSEWLAENVELPQYVNTFIQHRVTGATLPRLAVSNTHYVSNILGIKDPIHKQKIALKAMDVVLFGSPKGNRWKDLTLVALLVSAVGGSWYAYQQNKSARRHLQRMARDMEGLHRAEMALEDLQKELERARLEQESVATEKLNLERRLLEAPSFPTSCSDLEVQQLKQEIEMLRMELSRAEGELEDRCWAHPPGLQAWLQLTHELENKSHMKKRHSAEKQLQQARDACEKLRKKRSSLVGAFVSTHGKSIDEVDRSIVEARTALGEVTNELQERVQRWKQIESLCGFSIINNNGLPYLEGILYRNGSVKGLRGRVSSSQDDLDDDASIGAGQGFNLNWPEESSGSEEADSACTEPPRLSSTPVSVTAKFIVGADEKCWGNGELAAARSTPVLCDTRSTQPKPTVTSNIKRTTSAALKLQTDTKCQLPQAPPRRSSSQSGSTMARSLSADLTTLDDDASPSSADVRFAVISLETNRQGTDEETCSTDSSVMDDEFNRRRRKLHFPFSKKGRNKPS